MLADDFIEDIAPQVTAARAVTTPRAAKFGAEFVAAVRRAQRFVLSPLAVETAAQLADPSAVERTRDHLFTPAEITWVECAGAIPGGNPRSARHGFLLTGETRSIVAGSGAYVFDSRDARGARAQLFLPSAYDFAGDAALLEFVQGTQLIAQVAERRGLSTDGLAEIEARALGAFLGAALALINTPRIAHVVHHANAKLIASMAQRGRPPVLSYSQVQITLDRGELGLGEQLLATGERALHHVRSHMRLKRGRVELVRPHWRGNPLSGVRLHRHIVRRAEDEPGAWRGGPLPGPRIIRELVDTDDQDET